MAEKKLDQRAKLTEQLLKNTLVEMLKTQHISKISVRALCERAELNRSTFYTHYADTAALLAQMKQEVWQRVSGLLNQQDIRIHKPPAPALLARFLEYFKENAALFEALMGENSDFAFKPDLMEITQLLPRPSSQEVDPRTQEYVKTFGVTGCLSVIQSWLADGAKESPLHMAELLIDMLFGGIRHLGQKQE